MDLKETDILGAAIDHHWYYRAKALALIKILQRTDFHTILDVGAGSGFFSRYLLKHTPAQDAWCVDISYSHDFDELENKKPIRFRTSVDKVPADLVLLMDVLEHISDDVGFLSDYVNRSDSGTRFLISVPAFSFLWSDHDVFLEHKRRYTLREIENVAQRAGLQLLGGKYFFAAVFPLAASIRMLGRLKPKIHSAPRSQLRVHTPPVNRILYEISRWEGELLPINRFFGLTAFCIAEKP